MLQSALAQGGNSEELLIMGGLKNWHTPRANDSKKAGNCDMENPRNGLAGQARLWSTPLVKDAKNNANQSGMKRQSPGLNAEVASQIGDMLNPDWVELLMGFPVGYTDLETNIEGNSHHDQTKRNTAMSQVE
jgi:hypothetical protein